MGLGELSGMVSKKTGTGGTSRGEVILGDQLLPISQLHLDSQNPRHQPLEGDSAVIAQLCSEELIAELAEDIAIRSSLSPLDVLGVIPFDGHPGHYIAVEGNRRTCALILLRDPGRAPTPALQTQLRRIAATAKIPREIRVHVFANRKRQNLGFTYDILDHKVALVHANGMQIKKLVRQEAAPKHLRELIRWL